MSSKRQTFVKEELCPVVGYTVSLKGMRTSQEGKSVIAAHTTITTCDDEIS